VGDCVFDLCSANVETVIEQATPGDDEGILLRVGMHDIVHPDITGACPGSLMHKPLLPDEAAHMRAQHELFERMIAEAQEAKAVASARDKRTPGSDEHSKTPHPTDDRGWFSSSTAPAPRIPLGRLDQDRGRRATIAANLPAAGRSDEEEAEAINRSIERKQTIERAEAERRRGQVTAVPDEGLDLEECKDPHCPIGRMIGSHSHRREAPASTGNDTQTGSGTVDAALEQLKALVALAGQGFNNTTGAVLVLARELNTAEMLLGEVNSRAEGALTIARAAVGQNSPKVATEMLAYGAAAVGEVKSVEAAIKAVREKLAALTTNAGAAKISADDYLAQLSR
jgi:hypothetical protein